MANPEIDNHYDDAVAIILNLQRALIHANEIPGLSPYGRAVIEVRIQLSSILYSARELLNAIAEKRKEIASCNGEQS